MIELLAVSSELFALVKGEGIGSGKVEPCPEIVPRRPHTFRDLATDERYQRRNSKPTPRTVWLTIPSPSDKIRSASAWLKFPLLSNSLHFRPVEPVGKPIAMRLVERDLRVLRITLRNEPDCRRFVVEGKLAGECVGELEKCWNSLGSDYSPESILVDLSCVSFIDATGKQLLAQMHEKGIRIVANRLMPKCIIEEIERTPLLECQPQKSDVISS